MNKSVTVIGGKVWTQRSVTWNGNVASGNVSGRQASAQLNDPSAGDSPEDAPMCEWDSIQKGRKFTRRSRTR